MLMNKKVLLAVTLLATVFLTGTALLTGRPAEYPLPAHIELPPQKPVAAPTEFNITGGFWNDVYPIWSPDGKKIAFVSDRFGSWTIWIVNPSGGELKQISPNGTISQYPSWSPDGGKIAYWSFHNGHTDIFVKDLSSMREVSVTSDKAYKYPEQPQWSPDGRLLLFSKWSEEWHIWVADLSTFGEKQLTFGKGDDISSSWISGGKKVIYVSNRTGSSELWIIDTVSGEDKQLTYGNGQKIKPKASPDGRLIAYLSDKVPEKTGVPTPWFTADLLGWNVWFISIDGRNETYQYTKKPHDYRGTINEVPVEDRSGEINLSNFPQWTPDGKSIYYVAHSDTFGSGIFVWNVTDSFETQVNSFADETNPSWNPDGKSVAYASNQMGIYHIWIAGGEPRSPSKGVGY